MGNGLKVGRRILVPDGLGSNPSSPADRKVNMKYQVDVHKPDDATVVARIIEADFFVVEDGLLFFYNKATSDWDDDKLVASFNQGFWLDVTSEDSGA